jgi:hypothetical protein
MVLTNIYDFKKSEIYSFKNIAVVSHDAGAANLILGWIKEHQEIKFKYSLSGPALKIFKDYDSSIMNNSLVDAMNGVSALISGTSSIDSNLEHDSRNFAKKMGIYSIGVIDHWINYSQRFKRKNKYIYPDEIWVFDSYAFRIAEKLFSKIKIIQIPNYYLSQQLSLIHKLSSSKINKAKQHVLYLLEPINQKWGDSDISGEFQALDYFIKNRALIGLKNDAVIKLRLHPSEKIDKYQAWCSTQKNSTIELDVTSNLYELINWAEYVVGCSTAAMVLAVMANKKVISTLPPNSQDCHLPYTNIKMLRDLDIK